MYAKIERIYKQSGYKPAVNRTVEIYKQRNAHSYFDPGIIAEELCVPGR
jgi:hypothetical protein